MTGVSNKIVLTIIWGYFCYAEDVQSKAVNTHALNRINEIILFLYTYRQFIDDLFLCLLLAIRYVQVIIVNKWKPFAGLDIFATIFILKFTVMKYWSQNHNKCILYIVSRAVTTVDMLRDWRFVWLVFETPRYELILVNCINMLLAVHQPIVDASNILKNKIII